MKWTNAKVNKLTREEMIELIDKAEGMETVFTGASKQELKNKLIDLINKGLV